MKTLQILRIRLSEGAVMGRGAVIMHHIGHDSQIDGKTAVIAFDKDPRFLRVEYGGSTFELIPLTNVTSIMVEESK